MIIRVKKNTLEKSSGVDFNQSKTICAMDKSRYIGMVIPPLIGNPYNGYINPYYWVDDHPLLYGNNGSLDHGTYLSKSGSSSLQTVRVNKIFETTTFARVH